MKKRFELKHYKDFIGVYDNKLNSNRIMGVEEIFDLLNEQNKKIEELESQVVKWKQDYENCSKLEKNMSKEHQYCLDNWRKCQQENQQLKEEIKQLKFDCAMYKSANYLINDIGIDKAREIMFQSEKKLKQSQNSKAIEELSNLKAVLVNYVSPTLLSYNEYVDKVFETIDNQINELKGAK